MEKMSGGHALARQLVREDVHHVFGLPGDQLMHALDGLYDEPSIQYVTTRHEQGTTYLADGYARATGRPGVAFVVPGVGVYNAGSGLATAWAASSPVLLIAGQVNRHGIGRSLGLLHEVDDQLDVVRPITAWQQRGARGHRDPRRGARGDGAVAAGPAPPGRDRDAPRGVRRRGRDRAARPRARRARAGRPRIGGGGRDRARRRRAPARVGGRRRRARRRVRAADRARGVPAGARAHDRARARAPSTTATRCRWGRPG